MATFSRFADLPPELRLLIWEAAIHKSPSVHFLSYPRRDHTVADNQRGRRPNRWHSEILNSRRPITVSNGPQQGGLNTQTGSTDSYSSYVDSLALLHACQESRRVCLAHSNSSSAVSIGPCASIPIDLDKDIICIQDPTSRLPWTGPPRLRLLPELSPVRIAIERGPHTDCDFHISIQSGHVNMRCNCVTGWIALEPMYRSSKCFVETLGCQYMECGLKVIYLLDYAIKPKYTIAPDTGDTDVQGFRCSCGSEQHGCGSSAVNQPVQYSKHNGKFHGHFVTFYALPYTDETFLRWDIPPEAMRFLASFWRHLCYIYDYNVVDDSRKVTKGGTRGIDIAVEFLACIRD